LSSCETDDITRLLEGLTFTADEQAENQSGSLNKDFLLKQKERENERQKKEIEDLKRKDKENEVRRKELEELKRKEVEVLKHKEAEELQRLELEERLRKEHEERKQKERELEELKRKEIEERRRKEKEIETQKKELQELKRKEKEIEELKKELQDLKRNSAGGTGNNEHFAAPPKRELTEEEQLAIAIQNSLDDLPLQQQTALKTQEVCFSFLSSPLLLLFCLTRFLTTPEGASVDNRTGG